MEISDPQENQRAYGVVLKAQSCVFKRPSLTYSAHDSVGVLGQVTQHYCASASHRYNGMLFVRMWW